MKNIILTQLSDIILINNNNNNSEISLFLTFNQIGKINIFCTQNRNIVFVIRHIILFTFLNRKLLLKVRYVYRYKDMKAKFIDFKRHILYIKCCCLVFGQQFQNSHFNSCKLNW